MKRLLLILAVNVFCLVGFKFNATAQSQNELLKNFNSTELYVGTFSNYKLQVSNKKWPITIERDGDKIKQIKIMKAGIIEEVYQPDVPGYPLYFYSNTNRIAYNKGLLICYSGNISSIVYVLAENQGSLNGLDEAKLKTELSNYLQGNQFKQEESKKQLVSDINKKKEDEKLANSIKGKNVQKLEVVFKTKESESGMQSKIEYGIKAYLTDKTVMSTPNIGGSMLWEDFTIEAEGAIPNEEYVTVDTDAKKIKNDKVTVIVKSKHHTNLSATGEFKLSFNVPIKFEYYGEHGCDGLVGGSANRGGNGGDIEMNVCNSADGKYVLMEIFVNGKLLHNLKVVKGTPVSFYLTGGYGCSGKSTKDSAYGGKGGDGGRGGNVIINKNPGTTGDNIIVYNEGGIGGKGGKGTYSYGASGNNGATGTKVVNNKVVNLIF